MTPSELACPKTSASNFGFNIVIIDDNTLYLIIVVLEGEKRSIHY